MNKFIDCYPYAFSVYEAVLPCAESSAKSNPLRSPSDWFFSLIFNSSIANHTSSTICQKLSSKCHARSKCKNNLGSFSVTLF